MGRRNLVSRSCLDFSVCLDRQRRQGLQRERSYTPFRCTHTSGVSTLQTYSHALRELGVLAVSVTSGMVSSRLFSHALCGLICSRSIRHAQRGLFAALFTYLGWARCSRGMCHTQRGLFTALLTRLTWARCFRGIRHARCGLFAALFTRLAWAHLFSQYASCPAWSLRGCFHIPWVGSLLSRYVSHPAWSLRGSSHTPYVGSLFSWYPSRPAWSLRGSSHMPYVGSLFSGSGGRSASHGDREVGLCREIIFYFDQMCFTTTGFMHSSSPYHPCGASIFPCYHRKSKQTKGNKPRKIAATSDRTEELLTNSYLSRPRTPVLLYVHGEGELQWRETTVTEVVQYYYLWWDL